jgi:hypothetical protein
MSGVGVFCSIFILKTHLNKEHVETVTGLDREKKPVLENITVQEA